MLACAYESAISDTSFHPLRRASRPRLIDLCKRPSDVEFGNAQVYMDTPAKVQIVALSSPSLQSTIAVRRSNATFVLVRQMNGTTTVLCPHSLCF
jgi:hypothetical protein